MRNFSKSRSGWWSRSRFSIKCLIRPGHPIFLSLSSQERFEQEKFLSHVLHSGRTWRDTTTQTRRKTGCARNHSKWHTSICVDDSISGERTSAIFVFPSRKEKRLPSRGNSVQGKENGLTIVNKRQFVGKSTQKEIEFPKCFSFPSVLYFSPKLSEDETTTHPGLFANFGPSPQNVELLYFCQTEHGDAREEETRLISSLPAQHAVHQRILCLIPSNKQTPLVFASRLGEFDSSLKSKTC